MTRNEDFSLTGLLALFLLAAGYCVTLLLTASYWFDELLKQPSWVVVAATVAALSLPIVVTRSARRRGRGARRAHVSRSR